MFDVQRKITYKNLVNWYKELREYRPEIPCCVVANKIDGECIALTLQSSPSNIQFVTASQVNSLFGVFLSPSSFNDYECGSKHVIMFLYVCS